MQQTFFSSTKYRDEFKISIGTNIFIEQNVYIENDTKFIFNSIYFIAFYLLELAYLFCICQLLFNLFVFTFCFAFFSPVALKWNAKSWHRRRLKSNANTSWQVTPFYPLLSQVVIVPTNIHLYCSSNFDLYCLMHELLKITLI